mmetsp:Transcript_23248/g.58779  ORF Transcript_23248/g.58779 Transcript_23248/m.58779 type:complete len:213 (-) Transcript_23248:433-1071(-)
MHLGRQINHARPGRAGPSFLSLRFTTFSPHVLVVIVQNDHGFPKKRVFPTHVLPHAPRRVLGAASRSLPCRARRLSGELRCLYRWKPDARLRLKRGRGLFLGRLRLVKGRRGGRRGGPGGRRRIQGRLFVFIAAMIEISTARGGRFPGVSGHGGGPRISSCCSAGLRFGIDRAVRRLFLAIAPRVVGRSVPCHPGSRQEAAQCTLVSVASAR